LKFGVIVFPGSNCDRDAHHVIDQVFGQPVSFIWHEDTDLSSYDCVILPGGFSYGDYLRAGAIARFSPVMRSVEQFARGGRLVLGICNGFQILLEAGLLPGAMLRNDHLQFRCSWIHVRVESPNSPFTSACREGQLLKLPIAHQEGSYFVPEHQLEQLERRSQILLRYCDPEGRVTAESNPNGSVGNVAGVCNEGRNVFALMPHPERCCEAVLGGTDGANIFRSILQGEDWGAGGAGARVAGKPGDSRLAAPGSRGSELSSPNAEPRTWSGA
jgi:phosphoribosylformylglycinamidine synthase I